MHRHLDVRDSGPFIGDLHLHALIPEIDPDGPLVGVDDDVQFGFIGGRGHAPDDDRWKSQALQPVLDFKRSLAGLLEILSLDLKFSDHGDRNPECIFLSSSGDPSTKLMIDFPKGAVVLSRKLRQNPGERQSFQKNQSFYRFCHFPESSGSFLIIPIQPIFRKENEGVPRSQDGVAGWKIWIISKLVDRIFYESLPRARKESQIAPQASAGYCFPKSPHLTSANRSGGGKRKLR